MCHCRVIPDSYLTGPPVQQVYFTSTIEFLSYEPLAMHLRFAAFGKISLQSHLPTHLPTPVFKHPDHAVNCLHAAHARHDHSPSSHPTTPVNQVRSSKAGTPLRLAPAFRRLAARSLDPIASSRMRRATSYHVLAAATPVALLI